MLDCKSLNKHHALVLIGSKVKIAYVDKAGKLLAFMSEEDFLRMYKHEKDKKGISIAQRWLAWPGHKAFLKGVTFLPGKEPPPEVLNLWSGYGVEPNPGEVRPFLDFMRDVICDGDEQGYGWLMAWLADAVQRPGERPGTAVVLYGPQGTGKSFFAKTVGLLFGRHFIEVCDPKHLVGCFTQHLLDKCLVFADEGSYASRQAAAKLKNMITSDTIIIEPKGIDAFQAPNNIRLIIAGNEERLVLASNDERRYAVFNLSTMHQQDHQYFEQLIEWRNNDGVAALLHYLMHYDTSGVNLLQAPKTKGLLQQKLSNLSPVAAWWVDKLTSGTFPDHKAWEKPQSADDLRTDFIFTSGWNSCRATDTRLGSELKHMVPGLRKVRPQGRTAYQFPPLAECREAFEAWIGHEIEWPPEEEG